MIFSIFYFLGSAVVGGPLVNPGGPAGLGGVTGATGITGTAGAGVMVDNDGTATLLVM